uniref:PH domain-containing protein n=1 Tax=Neolamprologus brichardi TaxID=32507 RepID=A0A3Q4MCD5_NEOBR
FGVCKSKWVLKTNIQKQSNHPDLHSSLLVCHDASSPPSQLVLLQNSCEAIVEGKEILDLPKLPSGRGRDCCFALILPQNKYLLLLAETSAEYILNDITKKSISLCPPLPVNALPAALATLC